MFDVNVTFGISVLAFIALVLAILFGQDVSGLLSVSEAMLVFKIGGAL